MTLELSTILEYLFLYQILANQLNFIFNLFEVFNSFATFINLFDLNKIK